MTTPDASAYLEAVINLAEAAGERILAVYGTDFRVLQKKDSSPVTEADRLANSVILSGLARLTPDIPAISEEGTHAPFAERAHWENVWLIDPLDGTREFIKRNGEFTVNIALVSNQAAILGVVYAPVGNVFYYALKGSGAFKRKGRGRPVAINAKSYDVRDPMVITGSRSHNVGESLKNFISTIGFSRYIPMGSALKSCLVAEGAADVYARFGATCEWDTAATQCIVEEAGGGFTDLNLRPLRYNAHDTLLNPQFLVFGDTSVDWKHLLYRAGIHSE